MLDVPYLLTQFNAVPACSTATSDGTEGTWEAATQQSRVASASAAEHELERRLEINCQQWPKHRSTPCVAVARAASRGRYCQDLYSAHPGCDSNPKPAQKSWSADIQWSRYFYSGNQLAESIQGTDVILDARSTRSLF